MKPGRVFNCHSNNHCSHSNWMLVLCAIGACCMCCCTGLAKAQPDVDFQCNPYHVSEQMFNAEALEGIPVRLQKRCGHHGHSHGHSHGSRNKVETEHAAHTEEANPAADNSYSPSRHVVALIILTVVSLVGSLSPLVLAAHRNNPRFNAALLLGGAFGGGTVLATAFIHMIPPALELFQMEELSGFWTSYESWGGLFVMLAALLMQLIHFSVMGHYRSLLRKRLELSEKEAQQKTLAHQRAGFSDTKHENSSPMTSTLTLNWPDEKLKDELIPISEQYMTNHTHAGSFVPAVEEIIVPDASEKEPHAHAHGGAGLSCCAHPALDSFGNMKNRQFSVYLLEFGVAVHSIIIGVALGTTNDAQLTALLIAISFHQLFEGFALGAAVVEANFSSMKKAIPFALVYAFTTPLGILIGILINNKYDPNSATAILTEAIFDSLSAGILIYTALVEIIHAQFTANDSFHDSSLGWKIAMFVALWLGVATMSIIGIWA